MQPVRATTSPRSDSAQNAAACAAPGIARFASAIRRGREQRCYSLAFLAEQLSISEMHLKDIEEGTASPDFELVCRLAVMFDLSLDRIIYGQKVASARRTRVETADSGNAQATL